MQVDVAAVRKDLQMEFTVSCCGNCSHSGNRCEDWCKKVYDKNYLSTDHCLAVIQGIFRHCSLAGKAVILALANDPNAPASSSAAGPAEFAVRDFCVRVIELNTESSGCVQGRPMAPGQLTVAREHGNHFVPVLRCTSPAQARV